MARRGLTAAGLLACVLAVGPAYAASGSPPVTHPDTVTVPASSETILDVTDNDGDPDGDGLEVCRLQPKLPRALSSSYIFAGDLVLVTSRRARGTYTLTYYACDASTLTPGTLTITVGPPRPTIEIIPLDGKVPGRLKIKNTYERKTFRCSWHSLDSDRVDGEVRVPPRSVRIIRVEDESFAVDCTAPGVGASFVFDVVGRSSA